MPTQPEELLLIKIIDCPNERFWYKKQIGKILFVIESKGMYTVCEVKASQYEIRIKNKPFQIRKKDCIVLK